MKSWFKGVSLFLFFILLTACGSGETDSNDTGSAVDPEGAAGEIGEVIEHVEEAVGQDKDSTMTVATLVEQAQQAGGSMTSMHADIDLRQKMSAEQMEMNSVIDMQMDLVTEPLAMHQQMLADVEGMGQFETEMYKVADGFYMKVPGEMGWMKFSDEAQFAELLEGNMGAEDVQVDYAMFEEFTNDFQLEEMPDAYVLSLSASGERFNDFVKKQMSSTGLEDDLDALDDMTVHGFSYKVFIDKESFHTNGFHLLMEIDVATDEGLVLIEQDLDVEISKVNEITEIKVPADVVEKAVSFSFE